METRDPLVCPYQAGRATVICVGGQLLVPSLEEQKRYCKGNFRECPYYLTAQVYEEDRKTPRR